MRARQTARADWCAVERAASCWPGREGASWQARQGGRQDFGTGFKLLSSSWCSRRVAPPCGDLLPILLRGQDIWGGVYCCQVEVGWKKEEERLMGCLRRLRGLCNVQMCKLCSMMTILGPTALSIIVQRCIQPRSRKDKRFIMNRFGKGVDDLDEYLDQIDKE